MSIDVALTVGILTDFYSRGEAKVGAEMNMVKVDFQQCRKHLITNIKQISAKPSICHLTGRLF